MKKSVMAILLLAAGLITGCTTTRTESEIPEVMDTDPMIVQVSSMARTAFESGEIPRALVLYRRALERARAMDNSTEIAGNAYNLAACLVALEDWDEAVKLLIEAERETVRSGGDAGPAVLLLARIQRSNDDWKSALATLDRLEKLDVDGHTIGQAYVLRTLISCDLEKASEAEVYLSRARGYLRKNQDSGLAGQIAHAAGQIAMLNEQWSDAAVSFDREAAWMQRSARLYEMATALQRAGQNYVTAGDLHTASDRFFRSARSLMAQGYYLDALNVVEQAVALQPDDDSTGDAAALAALFQEIQKSVEEASHASSNVP